jgi:hypothetical protein
MVSESGEGRSVQLDPHDALVLFDFVSRFTETDQLSIADPAERAALWNLCAVLESVLVEPLRSDYEVLLRDARSQVRQRAGL